VGIAVAYAIHFVSRLTRDSVSNVALTVLAAYISWILGEKVGASAVLSCVACGLTMRRHFLTGGSSATRVQTDEVWRLFVFVLNGFIFVQLGLEWPQVRRLFHAQVLRAEWFTPHVHEVAHGTVRLILRRSEALRQQAARRRADKLAKLERLITTRNAFVQHPAG
jgi:NhaP-type Na+/H+ or K+/H+ antiporter